MARTLQTAGVNRYYSVEFGKVRCVSFAQILENPNGWSTGRGWSAQLV